MAMMVGGRSAGETLKLAKSRFRGLVVTAVQESDLITNNDTGLASKTTQLALGQCDVFMSHSVNPACMAR